jgi:glycosyltransferase involved in cell wall biosynthesis
MTHIHTQARISTIARTPGLDAQSIEIAVTVPTFRRPDQLLETLESLKKQRTKRRFAVVVIENDAEGRAGAAAAAPLFESGDIQGILIVAHDRGNCCAYNAGWETALTAFPALSHIAVIDDDEVADPDWIENMRKAADAYAADIVGGPQFPVFPDSGDRGRAKHPLFLQHYDRTGPVPILYSSGNLLIGRQVLAALGAPYMDLRFNFTGGGDSDFLTRAVKKGFRLAWCEEAPVRETVPERRLEFDWIRARSLRNGALSTWVERTKRSGMPFGRLRVLAKSLALLAASPFRALPPLIRTGSPAVASYPILIGIGRVLGEFGYSNEQYRQPEKN